jgi:hypothetical protein
MGIHFSVLAVGGGDVGCTSGVRVSRFLLSGGLLDRLNQYKVANR